ncbi:aminotransferase class IV family protein [Parabacteroides faecis]|uniref:aminotransferase class IV family protein n=1 Tax=Parabacteroides faecis TaxID=1217282 RepID=UPI00352190AF
MCPFIETIRIENGKAVNMAFHNYRFNRTRRDIFECNLPVNLADFIQPGEYTERTRCRVEYQEEVEKVEYLPYTIRPVNSLKIVTSDGLDYTYKSTDRQKLDELFGQRGEADDILIVRDGLLTDTSIANIALWDGSKWETPEVPLLEGTMRASLLGKEMIVPAAIRPQDLSRYSLIRLFNSMIGFGEIEFPVTNVR